MPVKRRDRHVGALRVLFPACCVPKSLSLSFFPFPFCLSYTFVVVVVCDRKAFQWPWALPAIYCCRRRTTHSTHTRQTLLQHGRRLGPRPTHHLQPISNLLRRVLALILSLSHIFLLDPFPPFSLSCFIASSSFYTTMSSPPPSPSPSPSPADPTPSASSGSSPSTSQHPPSSESSPPSASSRSPSPSPSTIQTFFHIRPFLRLC